jgi:tetratricopeptide (TPR) repeat protein
MDRSRPTLGVSLIARDEEEALPGLLQSVGGAFDEAALLDTGSTDRTAEVFADWARAEAERRPGFRWRLEHFAWSDDFALARNAAQELLDTDWVVWADADDELSGALALRSAAGGAGEQVAAFSAHYDYARMPGEQPLVDQWRIRMVRAGSGRWRHPVHEQLVVDGRVERLPADASRWIHRKPFQTSDSRGERNLRILRRWLEREPDSLRALDYLGREEALRGDHEAATRLFSRYDALSPAWNGERVLVGRQLSLSLIALGRWEAARAVAAAAAKAVPDWPDSHLTLAEIALERGEADTAIRHARRALELGRPDATIATARAWYTLHPRVLLARALRAAGRNEEAAEVAQEGLAAGFAAPAGAAVR